MPSLSHSQQGLSAPAYYLLKSDIVDTAPKEQSISTYVASDGTAAVTPERVNGVTNFCYH